jgi:hypothetical protein
MSELLHIATVRSEAWAIVQGAERWSPSCRATADRQHGQPGRETIRPLAARPN